MRARIRTRDHTEDGQSYHLIIVDREGAQTKSVMLECDADGWVRSVESVAAALQVLAHNLEQGE